MHKILLSIVLLFAAISSIFAQKLTVESFKLASSDLTAQTQPRKDLNNRNCALIKVGIGIQGVQFEGGIVGNAENKTGEYWVYMPQGNRMLKVKHANYAPVMVTFADYGVEKVESNRTYELTITASGGVQSDQKQKLIIRYSPSSATVLVDNKMVKGMNGVAQTTLPVGQHSYIVACDGYESEEGMVKLKASAPSDLQITLSKEVGASTTTMQHVVPQRNTSASTQSSTPQIATQTAPYQFTGKVVDKNSEPIIGAAIIIKGTTGTISDMDGNFVLKANSPTLNVVVSYIGLKTKKVTLNAGKPEYIVLK